MPDTIPWPTGPIPLGKFLLDNSFLTTVGLTKAFLAAAGQPTAELGAFNTAEALLQIEYAAIQQGQDNRLAGYNAYRTTYGMKAAQTFSDISSNLDVVGLLTWTYGDVDKVEFYPGIFAEDRSGNDGGNNDTTQLALWLASALVPKSITLRTAFHADGIY